MDSSRLISPFSFKTKMTSKNETPERFVQTTGDEIINKRLHMFNITIDQCKIVPKCWFNDLTNVTFYKSSNIAIATYGSLTHSTTNYIFISFDAVISKSLIQR